MRHSAYRRLLTFVVALALLCVAATESAAARGPAAAPARPCALHASGGGGGQEGAVALSIGCANEARGELRGLAKSGDDLMVVLDFKGDRGVHDRIEDVVEETRADRSAGMTLGESFTKRARDNSVGIYPPAEGGAPCSWSSSSSPATPSSSAPAGTTKTCGSTGRELRLTPSQPHSSPRPPEEAACDPAGRTA
ncbi:hypothetical protein ACFQ9J_17380 [Streptomyces sp. NPDC056529]|uniref:hypothetical protein n=1 Tax=Streptomyces sp. NPDC056529 TaxID=3345855 RepID=UPI0036C04F87